MSLLAELNDILDLLDIPVETGVFSSVPTDEYLVITPMNDKLSLFADNEAYIVVSEARLSIFTKNNYIKLINNLTKALISRGITITDRQYVGYEHDTKYYHYAIDVMKEYEMEG